MNEIIIIFVLILLNGAFSMAEIALISARKSSLTPESQRGNKAAKLALKLAETPDRFLSTVQIGITLIGILTGIYSGSKIAALFSQWLATMGVSEAYAHKVAQTGIVIFVTYLTLVFGELLPKRIGMNNAERVAKFMARPMHWLSTAASPFVWILSKSTSLFFSLLGMKEKSSKVTEEEIKSIIKEGNKDGEVQDVEQDIVERVFLMGDLNIASIMTHKHEIAWFDISMNTKEIKKILEKQLYEVYPVTEGGLDHVLGFVSVKDLLFTLHTPDFSLKKITSPAPYFYENTSVYKVLEIMKRDSISRGLVCDEFGSCIGIVTLKDMMHCLVGEINDSDKNEKPIIKRKDKDEWIVDGQYFIYDFLKFFNCNELYTNEDYTTVAGLCLEELGHVPEIGEKFTWHAFTFEVCDMDGARIDKLLITRNNE